MTNLLSYLLASLNFIIFFWVCPFFVWFRSEYQIQIQVQPQDPMALDLDVLQGGGHTLTVDSSQIDISHLGHVVVIPSSGIITTSSAAHHQHLNNNSSMANNPPPSKPKAKRKKRANNNNAANNNHSGVIAVANSIQHGVAHAHTISGTNIHVEILANPNHRWLLWIMCPLLVWFCYFRFSFVSLSFLFFLSNKFLNYNMICNVRKSFF